MAWRASLHPVGAEPAFDVLDHDDAVRHARRTPDRFACIDPRGERTIAQLQPVQEAFEVAHDRMRADHRDAARIPARETVLLPDRRARRLVQAPDGAVGSASTTLSGPRPIRAALPWSCSQIGRPDGASMATVCSR